MSNQSATEGYGNKDVLQPLVKEGRDGRSMSNINAPWDPRGASMAHSGQPPGSFSSDLKTMTLPRMGTSRAELGAFTSGDYTHAKEEVTSEQRQSVLRNQINKETKIKVGSENLLEALISKNAKQTKDQRQRVETELNSSNFKIAELKSQLDAEVERAKRPDTPNRTRLSGLFQGSPLKSPSRENPSNKATAEVADLQSESPTYVLAEILQALEIEDMQPDYYVERANRLVDLFKRYSTLKFDLAWPIFGLRMQTMLLSDSRDVIAAGYRVTRHAIADRSSLKTIRNLSTDNLVILSLIKDSKASIEREQALKFIRAFLDVKDGVHEISNAVLRTIVSIAEHHEDRLRNIALLTVSEVLIRDPSKALTAGSISPLADALVEGIYNGSESLAIAFLYLADKPRERAFLKSGHELEAAFTPFTDPLTVHGHEGRLKSCAGLISAVLKTWPGVFLLSGGNFSAFRSLLSSMYYPSPFARELILDLLFDVLCIKPPSWTSSFLAGRRLTTYGRVATLKADTPTQNFKLDFEEESNDVNLVNHFTTLLLAIFVHCGVTKVFIRP
jgi:rapamycin-insensitive companion of mTOR